MTKERVSINLEDEQRKWIQDQIKKGEFDNESAAVRKCILIAKRVYENSTPIELIKFIHGKNSDG